MNIAITNPETESLKVTAESSTALPEKVEFSNPFFTFCEEITFERRDGEEHPVMIVPMQDQSIAMHFPGVIKELSLTEDDSDHVMLETVSRSLDFVCMLRVGDTIPTEVTTGSASWSVHERHREIAHHRLMLKILSWITKSEREAADAEELATLMNDPEIRKTIDEGFISVAEALGYERSQKEEVVALVELLAEELSYIEALREVYQAIRAIKPVVSDLIATSKFDDFMRETANSVDRLTGEAIQSYQHDFLQLDAQTGEIISVLKNADSQVRFIREMRDDLARRLLAWDGIENKWQRLKKKNRTAVDEVLMETYRFLALRFLPAVNWKLVSQSLDEQKNKSESVW